MKACFGHFNDNTCFLSLIRLNLVLYQIKIHLKILKLIFLTKFNFGKPEELSAIGTIKQCFKFNANDTIYIKF